MNPDSELKAHRPRQALNLIQEQVRAEPSNPAHRSRLFQILCVLGEWERARTQLTLLPELGGADGDLLMAAPAYLNLIECEKSRQEVFAGRQQPLIFGKPAEWLAYLVEATRLVSQGNFEAAGGLRERAFEAAPATPGELDGEPFEWICDADTRLGPVLEVILSGKYYWVPFQRIREVTLDQPSSLHERVWVEGRFTWINGAQAHGYIPVRYSGTELSNDGELQMAQAVLWEDKGFGCLNGLGQRLLATDKGDKHLLQIRNIRFKEMQP